MAPVIANDRHCFEVYGYDIIIDNDLKPWLIEINTSPSITSTTKNDCTLKTRLLDNVLDVVLPPSGMPKWVHCAKLCWAITYKFASTESTHCCSHLTVLLPASPYSDRWDKVPSKEAIKNFTQLNPIVVPSTKKCRKKCRKKCPKKQLASGDAPGDQSSSTKEATKDTTKEATKEATITSPPGGAVVKSPVDEALPILSPSNTLVGVKPKKKIRRRKRRSQSVPKPNSM